MEWKWACKICNMVLDDSNALIMHYLKEHRAAINYGVPMPIDVIPPLKEKQKPKPRPKQYEPVETEDEIPEEAEEAEEYKVPKKKQGEDFEDLSLE